MNAERWQQVESILDDALSRPSAEWPPLLDQACRDDVELRRTVEGLLERRAVLGDFLTGSVDSVETAVAIETAEGVAWPGDGARIGNYRLVREIAQGGMASVFLAERADGEFGQTVALKLLRAGLGTVESQTRFRTERQILASLSHPNIARLLDGGMTTVGLPFLVMEYVAGTAIDRYCEDRHLTIPEKLRLFLSVTEAVRYAHSNLVVHRDLKPSNILITTDGQVKLLDFGIAKLLTPGSELVTVAGHRWMTPEYAAPEQVHGGLVTTATDVYQLGLLLQELLTGRRPPARTEGSTPRPDRTQPDLERLAGGDLDAIVSKALRPEPEQRYLSVEALRDDLERCLTGRPVRAREGSAAYRTRKFVRRHRWALAVTATFVLLLSAYAATITVQTGRVRRALRRAEEQQSKAEGATQYLIGLFNAGRSGLKPGELLNAAQLLERGEQEAAQLSNEPLAQAQLLSVLGRVHLNMNHFERADVLLTRSLGIRRNVLGEQHADVAESLVELGALNRDRGNYDQARQFYHQALTVQRSLLGNDHPAVATTLQRLAHIADTPIDESIALLQEAIEVRKRAHTADHPLVAEDMLYLAAMVRRKGQLDQAEAWGREALSLWQRAVGPENREVARAMRQLSYTLHDQGNTEDALRMQRTSLAMLERLVGPDNAELRGPLTGLAGVLRVAHQYDEAETLLRRALAIAERDWSADQQPYANTLAQLAGLMRETGRLDSAETFRRRELTILRKTYGNNHTAVAGSLHNLGLVMMDRGKLPEAEELLLEARAIRARIFGPASLQQALLLNPLGTLARQRNHFAAAESLHLSVLTIFGRNGYAERNPDVQAAHQELVTLYEQWGKPELAAQHRAALSPAFTAK